MIEKPAPHTLVVGGTRGLGRELVHTLAKEGHVLSVISRGQPSDSDANIPDVEYWALDLLDQSQLKNKLSAIVSSKGKLNNLVFFQRYRGNGDSWEGEIQTTLTATKNVIQHLSNAFQPGENKAIVIVGSIASDFIADEQPLSYHVGKGGLSQLVRYYAVELGRKGIRVNSVSPGTTVKEESLEFYSRNKKLREMYESVTPLGRMGTSAEVAGVIAFLCSPKSSFVTGQNIVVDGGVSLQSQESLVRSLSAARNLSVTQETKKEED